ncbi:hybrid sensor histidine kinase/response regulator [Bremerella cremea]|uniref:histidine kinase n=1 Tax=Bremerella cremea TaxID=1031537 RepID=A0A368KP70_9BACT|nr:response regulator [Bremerella cremea]RCS46290.1 hybrid sensor histidine kinase/response regulator [Bremerella cremea]
MQILIADDSALVRAMLQDTLEEAGYDVIACEDGLQAWEAIARGESRLAVLDWMMPGLSGIDICRKLHDEHVANWVYAILLTSKDKLDDILHAFQSGASDHVCKPFREAELLARIKVGEKMINLQMELAQSQKLESVGQLAAGIAHEINTPTQYVSDNTRFLKDAFQDINKVLAQYGTFLEAARQGPIDASLITQLEEVITQADIDYLCQEIPLAIDQSLCGVEQVAKIVRAMKDFSHPGNTAKMFVNLKDTVETTISVARNEWKYVANVVTQFDESLTEVSCLPGELNQVLLNLIVNASHAIGDKLGSGSGERGTITIGTRRLEDFAEIFVQDTGTGIPESARRRIYDPFFTTKAVGKGTGQGLAISYSVVVEKHGGEIDFVTEEGVGTTFFIRLPLQCEVAA